MSIASLELKKLKKQLQDIAESLKAVPHVIDSIQEAVVQAIFTTNKLEKPMEHFELLDDTFPILDNLAWPDTSLYYIGKAILEVELVRKQETDKNELELIKRVMANLDKARTDLIELEFAACLEELLGTIMVLYWPPIDSEIAVKYVQEAIAKMAYNIAMEQYIFEGNATVQ